MSGDAYPGGKRGDGAIPMGPEPREIVGHKTLCDGSHLPLYRAEAEAMLAACDAAKAKRAADMPDEQSAIDAMMEAFTRLKELGWREAIYCPKDGSTFKAIEVGSTGIHDCCYQGEWPNGSWWVLDGDMWPSRPILFKKQ